MEVIKSKVKTKCVDIEGRSFVLVEYTLDDNSIMYGTIPYTEIDEQGRVKRKLNGLEVCLAHTIPSALDIRADIIKCEGMTPEQVIEYFKRKLERVA